MAPFPEKGVKPPKGIVRPPKGEEVVISGISGIFPNSNNTTEFANNLYNNVDMVTENDLNFHHPEAPRHLGVIDGLTKFDTQFFMVNYYHALSMEPINRKLLEQAYTAIYDAGINPLSLKGKKVGVFIGTSYSDTSNVGMYAQGGSERSGFILSGCGKSMLSNRISYWLDAKGPSYSLDCSCASSMVCLENAYQAIVKGECEAAVVGGGNICKLPGIGLNLRLGGMACVDGKTKCFDKKGDGSVRSEAISCIFLQKAKDAKRIYAELYYAKVAYGLNNDAQFLPTRTSGDIEQFLKTFYADIEVSPKEVEYVEANGSAIAEADANEVEAICNIFSNGNEKPIEVGCLKSNMGHAEPASGVCGITKICLAYQKGQLPANLHYSEPVDVPALKEGQVKVLSNNEPFQRGFTAMNLFSFNGTNCHALLKGHYKPKDTSKYNCSIPRLVLVSGRQEDCVNKILNILESQPIDPEVIGMLHNISQIDTPGHTCRGYTILDTDGEKKTVTLSRNAEYCSGAKRPLCLVFSGMGSQWPGMAADLMKIPIFASAMHKCHKALEPLGIDLMRIVTETEKSLFDNILYCFIGITAVQAALTDVLKAIGVEADYVIGHSQGEMCCAYWDDCFTTEDLILAAYSRGIVSLESTFSKGAMAAVGLGYKDISPLCPPEIDVACHNSNTSATLSGPAEALREFTKELTNKGIFAREVQSANIAFHSRYIRQAGPIFNQKLKAIIKEPKLRSEKWISTSVPQDRWHEDVAKYSSAEYHTNNLMSPVYFEEASQLIPKNAVMVEVAPHGLLQAILKRSHPECTHINLTKRGETNQVKLLFEGIGKLYQEGFEFKLDALYPKIDYPVSTETQMISHYIDWEHSEEWPSLVNNSKDKIMTTNRDLVISVYDDEYQYIAGYIRNGNNVLPESAILVLVWETLAASKGVEDLSVMFQDIHFHGESIMESEIPLKLNISISKGNDYFEVTQEEVILANGYIAAVKKPKVTKLEKTEPENSEDILLNSDDIYRYLHAKGITCKGVFQSIYSTTFDRTSAQIKWEGNWAVLLDSLIQLNLLKRDKETAAVPKMINKLIINTDLFKKESVKDNMQLLGAELYSEYGVTICAGVEMKHIIFDEKPIRDQLPDALQVFKFVPYIHTEKTDLTTAFKINLQILAENVLDETISVTEVLNESKESIFKSIETDKLIPEIDIEINTINVSKIHSIKHSSVVILLKIFRNGTNINDVLDKINKDAFILTYAQPDLQFRNFDILSSISVDGNTLVLFKRQNVIRDDGKTYIKIKHDETFWWITTVKAELEKSKRVILISEQQTHCGLLGLVKMLKKEYPGKISLVSTMDYAAPPFEKNHPLYKQQLNKGMTINILEKGQWGNYYYLENNLSTKNENIKLTHSRSGNIEDLQWVENTPPEQNVQNLVQVCFSGLSIKDTQKILGVIDDEGEGIGYDFSGFDINGQRVMGLTQEGAIASSVQSNPDLLWPVPDKWTLEDAATVPWPFVQAYYLLAIRSQILKGHKVFVNDGWDAFGQAIISICLSLDCEVFTSVSDIQKKHFVLQLFPKLGEKNIGYTQNGDFLVTVMENTKGNGCDVVVNSASGNVRETAMKCVAACGVFLDVQDDDWRHNKPLGMSFICRERNYLSAKCSSIFKAENIKQRKMLQWMITEGIINGTVRPLSRIVYQTTEVPRAFRLLASNKHYGRILLKTRNAENKFLKVLPRLTYSDKGTYIVVSDETELGIELANRLVKKGARKIMLHLKSKQVPGYVQLKFASWVKLGVKTNISQTKMQTDRQCVEFLHETDKLGQVQGIFIVLDSTKAKESLEQSDFLKKYELIGFVSKLDIISRNNCPNLKQFVVLSRSSNNAVDEYATSVIDQICHARHQIGLPALSFKISLLDELHAVHQSYTVIQPQNITTVFNALENSIVQNQSNVIAFNFIKQRDSQYLHKISTCLGVDNLGNIESRLVVNDLLTSERQLDELKVIVRDVCKLDLNVEKLKQLPIERLKSLARRRIKEMHKFYSELGAFYTFVDRDEYTATLDMVPMKTLLSHDQGIELDEIAPHVLLIPGFEGHHQVFEPVCERLKVRAMTLQLTPDPALKSIPDIARKIAQSIKKNFVFKSKFYLLGYSFGVNVALEVAAMLERDGHVGIVFCLDSSPDALPVQLDAYLNMESDEKLQNSIIEHYYTMISKQQNSEITQKLKYLTWTEKVNVCVNSLKDYASYTHEYIQNVIDSAYRRIVLAKEYASNIRLKSEVVLLKGRPHPKSGNLASDYGLSKYTEDTVKVYNLATDHATACQDCRVANVINKFIDPLLLEECKSNVCHTYTVKR